MVYFRNFGDKQNSPLVFMDLFIWMKMIWVELQCLLCLLTFQETRSKVVRKTITLLESTFTGIKNFGDKLLSFKLVNTTGIPLKLSLIFKSIKKSG